MERLHRFAARIAAEDASNVSLVEVIPVFHRWIQTHAVDGLLIDVADYSHVPWEPSVQLIAHEGNYVLGIEDGALGFGYVRKAPLEGTIGERIREVLRLALAGAQRLEEAVELEERFRFGGRRLEIVANDRMQAPNDPTTARSLEEALSPILDALHGGGTYRVTREADPRERLRFTVEASAPVGSSDLLNRLAA